MFHGFNKVQNHVTLPKGRRDGVRERSLRPKSLLEVISSARASLFGDNNERHVLKAQASARRRHGA